MHMKWNNGKPFILYFQLDQRISVKQLGIWEICLFWPLLYARSAEEKKHSG